MLLLICRSLAKGGARTVQYAHRLPQVLDDPTRCPQSTPMINDIKRNNVSGGKRQGIIYLCDALLSVLR